MSDICGEDQMFLGELNKDHFWRLVLPDDLRETHATYSGSCIWDFADYTYLDGQGISHRALYSGAYYGQGLHGGGPIYRNSEPINCSMPQYQQIHATYSNNWALEVFRDKLYVGSGAGTAGPNGGRLHSFDGQMWNDQVYEWATTVVPEGASALAVQGDAYLYIGLGLPDGYDTGDGTAEVWRYDGQNAPIRISGVDQFGGGVQCLLSALDPSVDCNGNEVPDSCDIVNETSYDCNDNDKPDECDIASGISLDCNGNGVPDECDTAGGTGDCNINGIPDVCESDCDEDEIIDACDTGDSDGDGVPDNEDNCPCLYPNPDQADCDGDGVGNACDPSPSSLFDYDSDCDVDQADFAALQYCASILYSGTCPSECYDGTICDLDCAFPGLNCSEKDVDADGLIVMMEWQTLPGRLIDFRQFAACASGPTIPADGSCGDCNNNGIYDAQELGPEFPDGDGDFVPDICDVCPGFDDLDPDKCDRGGESLMGGGTLLAEGGTDASAEAMGDAPENETMDPPAAPETAGLASAVSLSVVGNPYPGPYVASRTESAGFDDPFVIWTWVEADGDLDGLQYRLRVNGGDDDDLFRLVGYAEGPLSWWNPWFDGFGELFVISGGFGTGDYGKLSVPVALDAVGRDEVVFNISRYAAAEAFPETLVGYVIEPVAPLAAGDYVFSAGGSALTGGVPLWVASPLSGTTSDDEVFTLTITAQGQQ